MIDIYSLILVSQESQHGRVGQPNLTCKHKLPSFTVLFIIHKILKHYKLKMSSKVNLCPLTDLIDLTVNFEAP